mgnify:CR=1 FL=1
MSSVNFLPGIQHVDIYLKNKNQVKINFAITGINRLYNDFYPQKPFYLYIILTYQDGGRETIVLSSSYIHLNETMLNKETLNFTTTLEITNTEIEKNEDFLLNYYSVEIIYSDFEAQDGADINTIFYKNERLFRTKLNVKGEPYER